MSPDSKIVARVQGLLAKAESTTFPEEAEALIAKAQELMTRYSISEALAAHRTASGAKPETRVVLIEAPYTTAKAGLLTAVADANNVRCLSQFRGSRCYLVGFDADIDATELMFGSLLVQAATAMLRASATDVGGRVRAFRHAFLVAYANRVGQRLYEARCAAEADAQVDTSTALVPLIAARAAAIDEAVAEQFKTVRARRTQISHRAGRDAGVAAADRADMGIHRGVGGSGRALTR